MGALLAAAIPVISAIGTGMSVVSAASQLFGGSKQKVQSVPLVQLPSQSTIPTVAPAQLMASESSVEAQKQADKRRKLLSETSLSSTDTNLTDGTAGNAKTTKKTLLGQ